MNGSAHSGRVGNFSDRGWGDSKIAGKQTFHRWRTQYGGMKAEDAKRLRELEEENQRLKKIVADQALDIDMLKELAEGNF